MYFTLALACNQSALLHNMPLVFSVTQQVFTGVFKVLLMLFSYLWSQAHLSLLPLFHQSIMRAGSEPVPACEPVFCVYLFMRNL